MGEGIARDFLIKKNYEILSSNFHTRYGELDLIAVKQNKLIFVEVKLKVGEDFGLPEEMITPTKLFQVQQTATAYLQANPDVAQKYPSYQIDAVCIVVDKNNEVVRINQYENLTG